MAYLFKPEQIAPIVQFTKVSAEIALVGRQLVPVEVVSAGSTDGRYETITDTSEMAMLFPPGGEMSEPSMIEYNESSFPLWSQRRHWTISDQKIAADTTGMFQDDLLARTIRKMAEVEDKIIVEGWTNSGGTYISGATGLLGSAGHTHAASTAWNAGGDPYEDILKAIQAIDSQKLETGNNSKLHIVLPPGRYNTLAQRDLMGNLVFKQLSDIGISQDRIHKSSSLTSTVCLVVVKDPLYMKLLVKENENFSLYGPKELDTMQHYRFNIVDTFGIKVKETYAVYKITSI